MRLARAITFTVVVATMGAVGCGKKDASSIDPALAPLSHTSGQRLRARVLRSGSVETFLGWFDAEVGVPCFFSKADDGELRCLPITPPGYDSPFCDPVVIGEPIDHPQHCPEELYADGYALKGAACAGSAGMSVYVAGGVVDAPTTCNDRSFPAPGTYEPHSATLAPASTFERAYETVVPVGARLAQHVIVSDDGAREVTAIFDPTIGEDCSPRASVCVPSYAAFVDKTSFFADAACSAAEAIIATSKGCLASRYAASSNGCALAFVSIGAPVDGATLFEKGGAACTSTSADTSSSFFAAGAPVPDGTFAAVKEVPVGTGRIVALATADAQGAMLRLNGELEDTQLGAKCHVERVDGVDRCVPDTYAAIPFEPSLRVFADAACTQLVASIYGASCDGPAPKPAAVRVAVSACDAELHAVGDAYAGPVWTFISGSCQPEKAGPSTPFYRVGDRIASDTLAEATLVTE